MKIETQLKLITYIMLLILAPLKYGKKRKYWCSYTQKQWHHSWLRLVTSSDELWGPVRGGIDVARLNFKACHVAISERSDVSFAISCLKFWNVGMSLKVDVFNGFKIARAVLKWPPLALIRLLELNFTENVTPQASVKWGENSYVGRKVFVECRYIAWQLY